MPKEFAVVVTLPAGFEMLAPHLDWNLPTADERQKKRRSSSQAELRSLYDGVLPHMEKILAELDKHPLGKLPEGLHPLYNIALSVAEIAPHIELYKGAPGVPFAFDEDRFIARHGRQATWKALPPMADDE
jgi:hypothetical protein